MQRDLIYLLCIILGFAIFFQLKFNREPSDTVNKVQNNVKTVVEHEITPENYNVNVRHDINSDPYEVTVNYPVELSGKTRDEIYEIRHNYVKNSIFEAEHYKPSDYVFGQIIDGKPWYSANICEDENNMAYVTGPSEESRFINNPTMLVALEYPFLWYDVEDKSFCVSPENLMIPNRIIYSKSKNEIIVKYSAFPFKAKETFFYQLNGLNAVDLGYKYVYVDYNKSTYKTQFSDFENNPYKKIQEFKNFIHLGYSCKQEGGCNNGSPRQPSLEFKVYSTKAKRIGYVRQVDIDETRYPELIINLAKKF